MKTNDPASSLQTIRGTGEVVTSSSTGIDSKVNKTTFYEIDAEVLEHLPIMYQKMAGVFVDSGRLVITNGPVRSSMVRVEDSYAA